VQEVCVHVCVRARESEGNRKRKGCRECVSESMAYLNCQLDLEYDRCVCVCVCVRGREKEREDERERERERVWGREYGQSESSA